MHTTTRPSAAGFPKKPPGPPEQGRGGYSAAGGDSVELAFDRGMMMVLNPGLVSANLPVKLVGQLIDSRIKVEMGTFCEQIPAFHMQGALGALP
jgi:hypothetical protein